MFEDFSRLVSGIHATVLTPSLWDGVLADIGRAVDQSDTALVVHRDGGPRRIEHANLPFSAAQAYNAHYALRDPIMATVESGPVGTLRTRSEMVGKVGRTEVDADWCRPNAFDEIYFLHLTGAPTAATLAVRLPKRSGVAGPTDPTALLCSLAPHLAQAFRTRQHLDDLGYRNSDLSQVCESLQRGILILAAGRGVVYANSEAERLLRRDDGLRISLAKLESSQRDSREPTGTFLCARPSGKRAYVLHVVPMTSTVEDHRSSWRRMVVIVDPDVERVPSATLLRELYGLTVSEAQVAVLVAQGGDPKSIAETLSVSLATVKTHLQHVFDKTDTHRQADLVRLLLQHEPDRDAARNHDVTSDPSRVPSGPPQENSVPVAGRTVSSPAVD
ncbi:helix-turn-helix transcriptional regulator [Mycolicibacillus trivialis]